MIKMLLKTVFVSNIVKSSKNFYKFNVCLRLFGTKTNPRKSDTVKLSLVGASIGALVGVGYALHSTNKNNVHIPSVENMSLIKELPAINPSKKVRIPDDKTNLKITLYQYQTCPFCCKVRAFLDYYGISYDIIEVNPVLRQSIKWSHYKKVPIVLTKIDNGYQQLNDSSMIISALSSFLISPGKDIKQIINYYPVIKSEDNKIEILNKYFLMMEEDAGKHTKKLVEEQKWRKWADNVLVHTLSPNVYRTQEEALQAFRWFSEVGQWENLFPTWERLIVIYVGAMAMWLISKKLKKRYNLKDDVRQSLFDECNLWMREIQKKGTQFMGGSHPDLSDLAVFGVLSSIEGCTAFQDLLEHSKILPWYMAMKKAVQNHEGMQHI